MTTAKPPKGSLFEQIYRSVINPPADEDISAAIEQYTQFLPTLWLLGKTGAGKSSIIQKLTGQSLIQVGNGFAPCTRTADIYNYPASQPVMSFLDTRGLSEAGYDPSDDLREASQTSHALLVVARVDDTDQQRLAQAITAIKRKAADTPMLVVHTCLHEVPNEKNRNRAIAINQQLVERAAQRTVASVAIDFTQPEDNIEPHDHGIESLKEAVVTLMPELHLLHRKQAAKTTENELFENLKHQVYWYAGVAAASDTLPAVGLVSVPGIQGKMLHSLAQHYGVEWTKRNAAELVGALGLSFFYRYSLSLGGRQLSKLIPVYGQSAGALAAASVSFISTYALGRTACKYLHAKATGTPIDADEIKRTYRDSLQAEKSARLKE